MKEQDENGGREQPCLAKVGVLLLKQQDEKGRIREGKKEQKEGIGLVVESGVGSGT